MAGRHLTLETAALLLTVSSAAGCGPVPPPAVPISAAVRGASAGAEDARAGALTRLRNSGDPMATLHALYGTQLLVRVNGMEVDRLPPDLYIVALSVTADPVLADRVVVDLTATDR